LSPHGHTQGWGRSTSSFGAIGRPETDEHWRQLLADAGPRGVIARGGGRGYGDVAQNAGGVVALTAATARIEPPDPAGATITVDAGVRLGEVLDVLDPLGFTLPVMPGTEHATVGGAIAADVHGKNHRDRGSFGRHVASMTLAAPGLGIVEIGPGSDAEAFWATVGGLGLTGVILRAKLAITTAHEWWARTDTVSPTLDGTLTALRDGAARSPYAVAWLDGTRTHGQWGGVVSVAAPAPAPRRSTRHGRRPPPVPAWPRISARPVTAMANRGRMILARAQPHRLQRLRDLLCPLDRMPRWPALHGREGLVQYQFSVPFGAEDVLAQALERPRRAARPATLAALKVLGEADPAPLSFPQPGWTLALDFQADPVLGPVLDGLDALVASAGGRVYLVKDSRMRAEWVPVMYPRLAEWRRAVERLDPRHVMASDLARRLGLTVKETQ
jgi:decaprenylphospho-beta-D-ribofuranose 2-oxidase